MAIVEGVPVIGRAIAAALPETGAGGIIDALRVAGAPTSLVQAAADIYAARDIMYSSDQRYSPSGARDILQAVRIVAEKIGRWAERPIP